MIVRIWHQVKHEDHDVSELTLTVMPAEEWIRNAHQQGGFWRDSEHSVWITYQSITTIEVEP